MGILTARVRNGRLILDEPVDLPEGTDVRLMAVDWDALDAEDRRLLHDALAASEQDLAQGRTKPADELLAELRRA